MNVKVRYFTTLRQLAGSAEEEIEIESHASLANLSIRLASKYGKDARTYSYHKEEKVDPSTYFLVNGTNAKMLSGLSAKLKDGDIVAIIPPIGGG